MYTWSFILIDQSIIWLTDASYLPIIGALLTLFAIGSDLFTQQAIRFYTCQVPDSNSSATLPLTTSLYYIFSHYSIKAAITDGLNVNGRSSGVIASCPSGFCSFQGLQCLDGDNGSCSGENANKPFFRSLGICHECANISPIINLTHSDSGTGFLLTNYILPTGQYLNLPVGWNDFGGEPLMKTSSGMQEALDPFQLSHLQASITNFSMLTLTQDDCRAKPGSCYGPPSNLKDVGLKVLAVECNLYMCVKTYSATVEGGKLVENVISTLDVPLSQPNNVYDDEREIQLVPIPFLIDGVTYNLSSITSNYSDNLNYTRVKINDQEAYVLSGCVYSITKDISDSLASYLSGPILGSSSNLSISNQDQGATASLSGTLTTGTDGSPDHVSTPYWLELFYSGGSASLDTVNKAFESMATAMTNALRTTDQLADVTKGVVFYPKTCIRVRWAWLAFPAILVGGSLLFLIATMFQTSRRAKHQLWKSSTFPLLFHGLSAESRNGLGLMAELDEMEDVAARLNMQLRFSEGGWRFVERDS